MMRSSFTSAGYAVTQITRSLLKSGADEKFSGDWEQHLLHFGWVRCVTSALLARAGTSSTTMGPRCW